MSRALTFLFIEQTVSEAEKKCERLRDFPLFSRLIVCPPIRSMCDDDGNDDDTRAQLSQEPLDTRVFISTFLLHLLATREAACNALRNDVAR